MIDSDSVLDIALASAELVETIAKSLRVCPKIGSDHLPVELCLRTLELKTQEDTAESFVPQERLIWNSFKLEEYKESIEEKLKELPEEKEVSKKWEQLKTAVWDTTRSCGMVKTITRP